MISPAYIRLRLRFWQIKHVSMFGVDRFNQQVGLSGPFEHTGRQLQRAHQILIPDGNWPPVLDTPSYIEVCRLLFQIENSSVFGLEFQTQPGLWQYLNSIDSGGSPYGFHEMPMAF